LKVSRGSSMVRCGLLPLELFTEKVLSLRDTRTDDAPLPPVKVKGKAQVVQLYAISGFRSDGRIKAYKKLFSDYSEQV